MEICYPISIFGVALATLNVYVHKELEEKNLTIKNIFFALETGHLHHDSTGWDTRNTCTMRADGKVVGLTRS